MKFYLTRKSSNAKTGPMPVSTSSADTCPHSCPFRGKGCYAETGPLSLHWSKVSSGQRGVDWYEFLRQISVLPPETLWRHNQAGDLAGEDEFIDPTMMLQLINANAHKSGYTYTHKDPAKGTNAASIAMANAGGFTVNLSADNLEHADALYDFEIGPVTVVLPMDGVATVTPKGRKVIICPALKGDTSCDKCKLCARADRRVIIGFPAHGSKKRIASAIADGVNRGDKE